MHRPIHLLLKIQALPTQTQPLFCEASVVHCTPQPLLPHIPYSSYMILSQAEWPSEEDISLGSKLQQGANDKQQIAKRRNRIARSSIAPDDDTNANRWHYLAFGAMLTTARQKSVKKFVRRKTHVFFAVSVTVLCVGACWWPLATLCKEWRGFG